MGNSLSAFNVLRKTGGTMTGHLAFAGANGISLNNGGIDMVNGDIALSGTGGISLNEGDIDIADGNLALAGTSGISLVNGTIISTNLGVDFASPPGIDITGLSLIPTSFRNQGVMQLTSDYTVPASSTRIPFNITRLDRGAIVNTATNRFVMSPRYDGSSLIGLKMKFNPVGANRGITVLFKKNGVTIKTCPRFNIDGTYDTFVAWVIDPVTNKSEYYDVHINYDAGTGIPVIDATYPDTAFFLYTIM